MKKVVGMVLTILVVNTLLSGCYSKQCDQPPPAPAYKSDAANSKK